MTTMAQFKKQKNSCISPEEVEYTKGKYAFTYNPEDQHHESIGKKRFNVVRLSIKEELLIIARYAETTGIIEVSKLGRIHYHGVITIHHIDFFIDAMPILMRAGTVYITHMKNASAKSKDWVGEYMTKQNEALTLFGYDYTLTVPYISLEHTIRMNGIGTTIETTYKDAEISLRPKRKKAKKKNHMTFIT